MNRLIAYHIVMQAEHTVWCKKPTMHLPPFPVISFVWFIIIARISSCCLDCFFFSFCASRLIWCRQSSVCVFFFLVSFWTLSHLSPSSMKLISCGGGVSSRRPQQSCVISVPSGARTLPPKQTAHAGSQLVAAPEARINSLEEKFFKEVKLLSDWHHIMTTVSWAELEWEVWTVISKIAIIYQLKEVFFFFMWVFAAASVLSLIIS